MVIKPPMPWRSQNLPIYARLSQKLVLLTLQMFSLGLSQHVPLILLAGEASRLFKGDGGHSFLLLRPPWRTLHSGPTHSNISALFSTIPCLVQSEHRYNIPFILKPNFSQLSASVISLPSVFFPWVITPSSKLTFTNTLIYKSYK